MSQQAAVAEVEETVETALPKRKKQEKRNSKKQPRYNVVLWNDDDHTYAYVITMLLGALQPSGRKRDINSPRRLITKAA